VIGCRRARPSVSAYEVYERRGGWISLIRFFACRVVRGTMFRDGGVLVVVEPCSNRRRIWYCIPDEGEPISSTKTTSNPSTHDSFLPQSIIVPFLTLLSQQLRQPSPKHSAILRSAFFTADKCSTDRPRCRNPRIRYCRSRRYPWLFLRSARAFILFGPSTTGRDAVGGYVNGRCANEQCGA
jgi:hypothetical protein